MGEFRQRIFALKGELAVLKKEYEELCMSADNSIITIREKLDPYNEENDFMDLAIESAYVEMKQLRQTYDKAKVLKSKIYKIEKELQEIEDAV